MYICKGCARELADDQFYPHPKMASGHLSFCKNCFKAKARAHRTALSFFARPVTAACTGRQEACRERRRSTWPPQNSRKFETAKRLRASLRSKRDPQF